MRPTNQRQSEDLCEMHGSNGEEQTTCLVESGQTLPVMELMEMLSTVTQQNGYEASLWIGRLTISLWIVSARATDTTAVGSCWRDNLGLPQSILEGSEHCTFKRLETE